jgi:tellurite resistance protein
LKPPRGETVSVYSAVCPAVTVADDGFSESEKSRMLKVTPLDDPPPGAGLNTVT